MACKFMLRRLCLPEQQGRSMALRLMPTRAPEDHECGAGPLGVALPGQGIDRGEQLRTVVLAAQQIVDTSVEHHLSGLDTAVHRVGADQR